MQCDFQQRGDFWLCPQCGLLVPRRGEKPPRATCPGKWRKRKAPKPRTQPTRRERLLALYDAAEITDPPRAEIERRLSICEACEEYEGYACITLGSPCRRADRWQEKVINGTCERFNERP